MEGKKSIKFWLGSQDYEFIKMAALLQKKSMSYLFREYARTITQNVQAELKKRIGELDNLSTSKA